MERVIVTDKRVGIMCYMQVCAVNDATTKEILEICNAQNPSIDAKNGWSKVIRKLKAGETATNTLPVRCESEPETRTHFIVAC